MWYISEVTGYHSEGQLQLGLPKAPKSNAHASVVLVNYFISLAAI